MHIQTVNNMREVTSLPNVVRNLGVRWNYIIPTRNMFLIRVGKNTIKILGDLPHFYNIEKFRAINPIKCPSCKKKVDKNSLYREKINSYIIINREDGHISALGGFATKLSIICVKTRGYLVLWIEFKQLWCSRRERNKPIVSAIRRYQWTWVFMSGRYSVNNKVGNETAQLSACSFDEQNSLAQVASTPAKISITLDVFFSVSSEAINAILEEQ